MNEVRCIAEVMFKAKNKECCMYYQDTDSFFMDASELDDLADAFQKKYNRPLRGKELGQFHSDFSTIDGDDDVKYAEESLFIRKKLYCNKLLMKKGHTDITYRSKGISLNPLKLAFHKRYPKVPTNDAMFQSYKDIYYGETIPLDLCEGSVKFAFKKDFSVYTMSSFKRRINGNVIAD
jgi:hypothetical protein